jgi:Potassium-transporting ATPase A subunit
MSESLAGLLFIATLAVALVVVHRPLGDLLYWIATSPRDLAAERFAYRLVGADPKSGQSWAVYARSVLAFSAVSILLLYGLLRLQQHLWLSLGFPGVAPDQAWNTAVSFVTNTNWQSYSGESTMGYLAQMAGLAVQNFASAAVGITPPHHRAGHGLPLPALNTRRNLGQRASDPQSSPGRAATYCRTGCHVLRGHICADQVVGRDRASPQPRRSGAPRAAVRGPSAGNDLRRGGENSQCDDPPHA